MSARAKILAARQGAPDPVIRERLVGGLHAATTRMLDKLGLDARDLVLSTDPINLVPGAVLASLRDEEEARSAIESYTTFGYLLLSLDEMFFELDRDDNFAAATHAALTKLAGFLDTDSAQTTRALVRVPVTLTGVEGPAFEVRWYWSAGSDVFGFRSVLYFNSAPVKVLADIII